MDRESWVKSKIFTKAHLDGVREFMAFVSQTADETEEIWCPCRRCLNRIRHRTGIVEDHLLLHHVASTYTRWIYHGEPLDIGIDGNADHVDQHIGSNEDAVMNEDEADPDDRIPDMLQELHKAEQHDGKKSMFAAVLEEMKKEIYPGSPYTRFSFVAKLLHVKSFYRISNVGFTAMLKVLSDAFPACSIPESYDEAKKVVHALGLGYDSIHVCPNNCVLFRKKFKNLDECPVCNASRWKDPDKKKIPQKVLRHFRLIPRLKRLFSTKKTAEGAQWHASKRKPVENELSHPADGEAWKDFDRNYQWFANDPRNIRLGLATDGFNPYGNMSSSYSMWPVFVMPYNFAPWECMDQSNYMMALLIPGPNQCPAKDFDVFLEPLIEELLELWKGVPTYDAFNDTMFDLHAAVIWCVHDYPALSVLSGRVGKGYYGCVHCDKDPCSRMIRNKICYIGNRRFLPIGHPWRKMKCFDGKIETRGKPEEFSTDEIMEQLERVKDVRPGKHPQSKKRKREADGQCWKRRSCLWDLPYWSTLKLRHNLDIMHIEKNICDYFLGTFLGIVGKTKDTISARLDLEDMGIRKHLHLQRDGDSYICPHASYTMTRDQKVAFCEFLKSLKFPDGYASNLATHVTVDGCNLQGLKTHDCHILLQRTLAAGIRGIMHNDIYEAVAELGNFFQQLCAKTVKKDVLERLKDDIPLILCKLEKIFPPRFFDICLHLAIHLPDEALLRGPVQYGWMYPVERMLCTLKRFVRNRARPEGSIAEAYVANECMTYCSRYFDDVDTRHNREGRNRERIDLRKGDLSVFRHGVDLCGTSTLTLDDDYEKMVWYVLNNCTEVDPYIMTYREMLQNKGTRDVERTLEKEFPSWFKKHITKLRFIDNEDINDDLYALACQPDLRVRKFPVCIVDGVRYHTTDREKNRRSQNSGIMVQGTHNEEYIDYYGCLKEIIELRYKSDLSDNRTVVLFRCDWYDTGSKKGRIKEDKFLLSINQGSYWYKDDPFILATQATKVFYLNDTKYAGWKIVQKFAHRHLWNVVENDTTDAEPEPTCMGLSYQDDHCVGPQVQATEGTFDNEHVSVEYSFSVNAVEVDEALREREEADESSDDEDDTGLNYASDNDEGPTVNNDDDSDYD